MNVFLQRIKKLEDKLKETATRLKIITEESLKLQNQNRSEINVKEQELEDWRNKLEILQQERNQIKKEIREKVQELEVSRLSNSEKQVKINQLLTEHNQELEEVDKLLYDERTNYRQIRDKLIGKLCEPCQNCQTKEQVLKRKDKKTVYLLGII